MNVDRYTDNRVLKLIFQLGKPYKSLVLSFSLHMFIASCPFLIYIDPNLYVIPREVGFHMNRNQK